MKNRIRKNNKTKFDYVCFRLGVAGLAILALTIGLGSTLLFNLVNENHDLTLTLADAVTKENKVEDITDSNIDQEITIIVD